MVPSRASSGTAPPVSLPNNTINSQTASKTWVSSATILQKPKPSDHRMWRAFNNFNLGQRTLVAMLFVQCYALALALALAYLPTYACKQLAQFG
jgi:hypothetical protein